MLYHTHTHTRAGVQNSKYICPKSTFSLNAHKHRRSRAPNPRFKINAAQKWRSNNTTLLANKVDFQPNRTRTRSRFQRQVGIVRFHVFVTYISTKDHMPPLRVLQLMLLNNTRNCLHCFLTIHNNTCSIGEYTNKVACSTTLLADHIGPS